MAGEIFPSNPKNHQNHAKDQEVKLSLYWALLTHFANLMILCKMWFKSLSSGFQS
jgi:hypothetical protein